MDCHEKKPVSGELLVVSLIGLGLTGVANAANENSNIACPVALVQAANGQDLDTEFGDGTSEITKCLDKRHQVKLVVQINQTPHYGLNNIKNVIDDYKYTNGMVSGRDY